MAFVSNANSFSKSFFSCSNFSSCYVCILKNTFNSPLFTLLVLMLKCGMWRQTFDVAKDILSLSCSKVYFEFDGDLFNIYQMVDNQSERKRTRVDRSPEVTSSQCSNHSKLTKNKYFLLFQSR